MNAKIQTVLLVVCLCLGTSSAFKIQLPSWIDELQKTVDEKFYQLSSTLRVVRELCFNKTRVITDELATDFFNCYDKSTAAGRAIYTNCQIETGGARAVMNTTEGIKNTCEKLYTFPKYAYCLSRDFKAANLSMSDAVTDVNKCELEVLDVQL